MHWLLHSKKRWQPNNLNYPKSLKSVNLLKKHYFLWPKYKIRYAYIYGNITTPARNSLYNCTLMILNMNGHRKTRLTFLSRDIDLWNWRWACLTFNAISNFMKPHKGTRLRSGLVAYTYFLFWKPLHAFSCCQRFGHIKTNLVVVC